MARLVEQGKVRYLGLCEAGADTIRRAQQGASDRGAGDRIFAVDARHREPKSCRPSASSASRLVAYCPLGRGFLSGAFQQRDDLIPADRRHAHPRFQEGNFEQNLKLLPADRDDRARQGLHHGAGGARLAAGARRRHRADPRHQAAKISGAECRARSGSVSTETEMEALERPSRSAAAAGLRYPEFQLKGMGI